MSGGVLILLTSIGLAAGMPGRCGATPVDQMFDDPLFRRCISWMLDGTRGAGIGNLCVEDYQLPSPALFICARKVLTAFPSETDQQACMILFQDEAEKASKGHVRSPAAED